jgi:hypothetical protein
MGKFSLSLLRSVGWFEAVEVEGFWVCGWVKTARPLPDFGWGTGPSGACGAAFGTVCNLPSVSGEAELVLEVVLVRLMDLEEFEEVEVVVCLMVEEDDEEDFE